jgi:hypothetical protein
MNKSGNKYSRKKKFHAWEEKFAGIPVAALKSHAFLALNKVERSLLFEFMTQYHGSNNGTLLCSIKRLGPRGFRSSDTLHRAKRVLIEAGFIYETVLGHRPNTASWYAITWRPLNPSDRYDVGVTINFNKHGFKAYERVNPENIVTFRNSLLAKQKSSSPEGKDLGITAPADGMMMGYLTPSRGTIRGLIH